MGLLGRAVLIVLTVPFVVGLYVLGAKPGLVGAILAAYGNSGVLGVAGVLVGAPDVLAVAGLAVLIVLVDPTAHSRSN